MKAPDSSPKQPKSLPSPVTEHLETIASIHAGSHRKVDTYQRLVEHATAHIGRPRTIAILLLVVVLWSSWNLSLELGGAKPLDPAPFFWLQGALAFYGALVSTVVLTTQNRLQRNAEHRAYLELQINLLAEQKTAKIIHLLEELRRDTPSVHNRTDPEAEAMAQAIDPRAALLALEETLEACVEERKAEGPFDLEGERQACLRDP